VFGGGECLVLPRPARPITSGSSCAQTHAPSPQILNPEPQVGLPVGCLPAGALPSPHMVCNGWWRQRWARDAVLEFTRDRRAPVPSRLFFTPGSPFRLRLGRDPAPAALSFRFV
jgi:hypothetical protein